MKSPAFLLFLFVVALPLARSQAPSGSTGLPAALASYRGVHPRLFVTARKLETLRDNITGSHRPVWQAFLKEADLVRSTTPTKYTADPGEQLWQRAVGNNIATLAFAYAVTRDRSYLDAAERWARASCTYPTWGLIPSGREKENRALYTYTGLPSRGDEQNPGGTGASFGLSYGHQLLGLAMLYDYAYNDIDPATRLLIRKTLVERASRSFPRIRQAYNRLQNHSWINATGLLASGLALFDEEPAATEWMQLGQEILNESTKMLQPDGASHEGFGYWQYGVEYLLKLMQLSRPLGQPDAPSPWWDHTADYALHMMLPRHAWTNTNIQVDYNDSTRYAWYGPDHQLRVLATRNHDGVAQWLADEIEAANVQNPTASWMGVIAFDPTLKPTPPAGIRPTLQYFEDMDFVAARSDWSGDESWLLFKAGKPVGKYVASHFEALVQPGDLGHVHRDANHFCLFGSGEWLIRNSTYGNRDAKYHNTLVVDGIGQWGDGKTPAWPPAPGRGWPRVVAATSTAAVDHIVGDAAGAYPPSAGVKRFIRHLLFIKPDVLVVADEIEVTEPKKLELFFHPEQLPRLEPDGSYRAQGAAAALRFEVLTPAGTTTSIVAQSRISHSATGTRQDVPGFQSLVVTRHARTWRNAVALSWSPAGGQPLPVSLRSEGDNWTFSINGKSVVLDWGEQGVLK